MTSYRLDNLAITVEKEGNRSFTKASYPVRFGKYSEIKTSEYEFHFNLKGEIKFIRGLNVNWPHPSEWLKRTDGNDWVFYSVGSVGKGMIKWLGEYYLPCLPYPSNSIWEFNPYMDNNIMKAFAAWSQVYAGLYERQGNGLPAQIKDFLQSVSKNDETALYKNSEELQAIIGRRISVLPPDTRHVDYEVIPLMIADGCLYNCRFCCVKSQQRFQPRPADNILEQIRRLKTLYNRNLGSYNALFLGNHDALGAGGELINMAVSEAVKAFGFENSDPEKPKLYLFGSVDSLLKADSKLLDQLNELPFYTYINVGFESVDAPTLADINKPVDISRLHDAFQKMLEINRDYADIEITANFLIGEQLSPDHYGSLGELLGSVPDALSKKGVIYLSPLMESRTRSLLMDNEKRNDLMESFYEIKNISRLPVFIYLIQRL